METLSSSFAMALSYEQRLVRTLIITGKVFIWLVFLFLSLFPLDFEQSYHVLPQRLFVPIAGSGVMLSDYKFGDEATGEIQERFVELLDQSVQAEDIHVAEDISTGKYSIQEPAQAAPVAGKMPVGKVPEGVG